MYEDQIPFAEPVFGNNPESRCPCILLLDKSISMRGAPIRELNEAVAAFRDDLLADGLNSMTVKKVEVAVITFGPVQVEAEFQSVDILELPVLEASGDTPMGAAIEKAVLMLEQRKDAYRNNGINYHRPWIFLITDGAPTDYWQNAAKLVHAGESDDKFLFFAIGVKGADMATLGRISSPQRPPVSLQGLKFKELFLWLSNSLKRVSASTPEDKVKLLPLHGWAEV